MAVFNSTPHVEWSIWENTTKQPIQTGRDDVEIRRLPAKQKQLSPNARRNVRETAPIRSRVACRHPARLLPGWEQRGDR
eukprot:7610510-Lingulodinium_polyedra.AAC.1